MTLFVDRLIIFLLSIIMLNWNQVDYVMVCLILVVFIMEGIIIYYDEKVIVIIWSIIFSVLAFVQPQVVVFFPIIFYELVRVRAYAVIPINLLAFLLVYTGAASIAAVSGKGIYILAFIVVAAYIGYNALRDTEVKKKLHDMRDEQSYLQMKNRQSKDELIRKQDYELHAATLAERNRIAREIHDHVGHMLSRSILQLGAIMAINKEENLKVPLNGLKSSLDTAMNNIRESVHDIKDDALDLEYMIKDIIREYETLGIQLDYDMGQHLSKEIKYCFIAIVKEALTNTVKHSDGNKVTIVMREHPAIYQMFIEDNGSSGNGDVDKAGIGLENMRERVEAFKGNIRFSNENGFKIFVSIPKGREE